MARQSTKFRFTKPRASKDDCATLLCRPIPSSRIWVRRAAAVRDALLAKGDIDAERVFLVTGQTGTATDGHVRLELKLR